MRVLQVGCELDRERRPADALLDAWPTLLDVARAAAGAGVQVEILQAGHRDEVVTRDGIRCHFVAEPGVLRAPGTRGAAGVVPFRLARRAATLRPDVVHLNGLAFPLHARALAAVLPRAALLFQDHGDVPPARRQRLHAWGLASASGACFAAREQARPFVEAGVLPGDVAIFEVPESSTRFTPGSRAAARAATGVHGDPALLWVGRLDANKDPLTVLDALSRARPRLRDPQLWCAFGDAPLLPRVRARLDAEPALAERVHLLGRVSHATVESLARAADFLLLASHREGCPYAVIEALACGATPIVSDIPAHRALTGRGAVGALFPRGDAAALADAIVASTGRDRASLRRSARKHFELELSFDAVGRKLAGAYASVRRDA
ncbi:MAG TPA: glycosyltransferase family 4 protein [Longimicrobiales bacterium]|nr:glycosyltransferase family 4 protein [Longimicrobiales bacterium]